MQTTINLSRLMGAKVTKIIVMLDTAMMIESRLARRNRMHPVIKPDITTICRVMTMTV
ncbi:MAG: hypothetical protein ACKVT0_11815 [Planctomycetaceae bacterium]